MNVKAFFCVYMSLEHFIVVEYCTIEIKNKECYYQIAKKKKQQKLMLKI